MSNLLSTAGGSAGAAGTSISERKPLRADSRSGHVTNTENSSGVGRLLNCSLSSD